jgi:molecular chaperone GrpE
MAEETTDAKPPVGEEEASADAAEAKPPVDAPEAAEAPDEPEAGTPGAPELGDDAAKYLALAQRTQADFENYRKRMAREQAQAVDRGVGKLARELLPALDHLDLALKASEGHEEVVRGFALVREEIVNALARVGIQPFAPAGEPFDPNEHEAMASQPVEDAEPGTIVEVYQQGYRINGAVLRPARVIVAA